MGTPGDSVYRFEGDAKETILELTRAKSMGRDDVVVKVVGTPI